MRSTTGILKLQWNYPRDHNEKMGIVFVENKKLLYEKFENLDDCAHQTLRQKIALLECIDLSIVICLALRFQCTTIGNLQMYLFPS